MTYHHGWLQVQESNGNVQELFNHARTAAYLQTSQALGCGSVYGVLDDGGCAGYTWTPCDTNADGNLLSQSGGAITTEIDEPIALESGDSVVPDWLGYWDAKAMSPSGPVNLGTAGDALNATNEGLVHVEGAAVWFPATASNVLEFGGNALPLNDYYCEFEVDDLDFSGGAERSVIEDRVVGDSALWVRFNATNNNLIVARGNGTYDQVALSWNVPCPSGVLAQFRVKAVGTTITGAYSLDGGATWVESNGATQGQAGPYVAGFADIKIGGSSLNARYFAGSIRSILVRSGDETGTIVVDFDAATDLPVDSAATSFAISSGQTATVYRASSGPVTVLVPSGHSVLINPDQTVAGNKLTTANTTDFDIGVNDDAVLVWTGQHGHQTGVFPSLAHTDSSAANKGLLIYKDDDADALGGQVGDGTNIAAEYVGSVDPNKLTCSLLLLDRTADTLLLLVYDDTGLISDETTTDASAVGVITGTDGMIAMSGVPGTWSSMAFNKPTTLPDQEESAALASAFLAAAVDAPLIAPDGWCQDFYSTPATDGAPWYNANYPESAEALGFWVTEWTGLDSGHVTRQVTDVGAYRGGGQFGATGAGVRTMGFEVILLGESEKALEYLFQWLDATISSVCATCATDSILVRRFCPDGDVDEIDEGVAELREVGMVQGLQWGAPPVEQAGCFIRRVNFTMAAADPCMYSACTGEEITQAASWNDCFDPANIDPGRAQCRPACSEMESVCRTVVDYTVDSPAASAPRIVLTAPVPATIGIVGVDDVESTSMPVRIRTYRNDLGLTPDELCGAPLLAELYVTGLPAYSELLYDMPGRTVQYRDPGTGDWINGYAFLEPNDAGVPRFAALGCGSFTTIMEPSNYCLTAKTQDVTINNDINSVAFGYSHIYAGGVLATAFGRTVSKITSVTHDGMRAGNFNVGGTVGVTANIEDVVVDADGKILIGGAFVSARGTVQNGVARLWPNGTLDETFNIGGTIGVAGGGARVRAIAVQADGKIIVGGDFDDARGTVGVNNLARLEVDGTLDTTFNIGGTVGVNGDIYAIAIQDDGKILIGGTFLAARGTTVNRLARLNTDGTVDTTFNIGGTVGVDSTVRALTIQPSDGRVVVGGGFTNARGTIVNRIIRLNNDGSVDGSWDLTGTAGADGTVFTVAIQSDGKIFIGGEMTNARGTVVNKFARLNSDGTLDTAFNIGGTIGTVGNVIDALITTDGKIVIGGAFTAVRGTAAERLARLNADGTFDSDFQRATAYEGMTVPPDIALSVQERMGCA